MGVRPVVATYGLTRRVGEVTVQTVWPASVPPEDSGAPGESGESQGESSAANDASVVLLVEVRGVRVLLTGDVEPPAQGPWSGCSPASRSTCSRSRTTAPGTRTSTSCWGCEPGWPWCRSAPTTTTATRPPTCSPPSPRRGRRCGGPTSTATSW